MELCAFHYPEKVELKNAPLATVKEINQANIRGRMMVDVKESTEPKTNRIMEAVVEIGIVALIAIPLALYLTC